MNEIVLPAEPAAEGGLTARALGHAIFTAADDEAHLQEMVSDAVACHFDEVERPSIILRNIR